MTAFAIYASIGRGAAHFTGAKFSTHGKAKRFYSSNAAYEAAMDLIDRFPVLRGRRVFVKQLRAPNLGLLKKNPGRKKFKKNPGFRSAADAYARELDEADERLAGFSGRTGKHIIKVSAPQIHAGLVVGKLLGVMYSTTRDGVRENYKHVFARNSRPLLIAKHDGTQLGIVGGQYRFTDAGIEDE